MFCDRDSNVVRNGLMGLWGRIMLWGRVVLCIAVYTIFQIQSAKFPDEQFKISNVKMLLI